MNTGLRTVYFLGIAIILGLILLIYLYPSSDQEKIDIIINKEDIINRGNYDFLRKNLDFIGMKLKPHEKKIIIFFLNDKTGDNALSWISDGFPSIINTIFGQSQMLEPIPLYSIEDFSGYIDYGPVGEMDLESSVRIGESMGADFLMQGDYYLEGDSIRFDIKIFNVSNSELLKYIREKAENKEAVFKTIHKISKYCLDILNVDFQEKLKLADMFTDNDEAFRFYQRGIWDYDQGLYSKAEMNFKRALEMDSGFIMCYYYLAVLFRRLGIDSGYIQTAYKNSSSLTYFYQKLIEAEFFFQNNRLQESIAVLMSLQNIYRIDRQVMYHIADYLYESGDYERSVEYIDRVIVIDPEYLPAYETRADILVKEGNTDEALEIISELIKKRPFAVRLYMVLASIFAADNRYDFALDQCRIALEMDSTLIEAKLMTARMLNYLLMPDEAMDMLQGLIIDETELPHYFDWKTETILVSLTLADNYSKALDILKSRRTEEPQGLAVSLFRTYLHLKSGEKDKAHKELTRAESLLSGASLRYMGLYIYLLGLMMDNSELVHRLDAVSGIVSGQANPDTVSFLEDELRHYRLGEDRKINNSENPFTGFYCRMKEIKGDETQQKEKILDAYRALSYDSLDLPNIVYFKELIDHAFLLGIDIDADEIYGHD